MQVFGGARCMHGDRYIYTSRKESEWKPTEALGFTFRKTCEIKWVMLMFRNLTCYNRIEQLIEASWLVIY
jgi:hypothetical protein